MSYTEPLFGFNLQQKKSLQEYLAEQSAVPQASPTVRGTVLQATAQNPAAAADVAALKTQFDALLTRLKAAGVMAN